MIQNTDVYDAAKAYTEKAFEFLAQNSTKIEPSQIPRSKVWVKQGENAFTQHDTQWDSKSWLVFILADELHSVPEYTTFVTALQSNPAFGGQLDTVVGGVTGGRHVPIGEAIDRLVLFVMDSVSGFQFDVDAFNKSFEKFEADFQRNEFACFAITPLPGFTSEVAPVLLEDGLELDRMTDGEIIRCLNMGTPVGHDLRGLVHVPEAERCAIRHRFPEVKRVGDSAFSAGVDVERERLSQQPARFLDVLHALRAFKSGRILSHSLVRFSEDWPVDGTTSRIGLELGDGRSNDYLLNADEAEALPAFWIAFRKARETPFLDAAIRRFGYAGERTRPEDRLIDLMIAAEALFLSDTTEAKERGEMRFRLSLRFAWFVEANGAARRKRFRHIQNAYDARSAFVHGGTPKEKVLELPNKGKVALIRFVDATEDTLRVALRKAIESSPVSRQKLVDWDSIMFG